MPRYEILACPFCHNGQIEVTVFGGSWQEKRGSRSSLGAGKSVSKSKIDYCVERDCKNCGAKAENIEKIYYKERVLG